MNEKQGIRITQNSRNNKLSEAIVGAIAFFDIFDFPMTEFEIWQAINVKCGLGDMRKPLKTLSCPSSESPEWDSDAFVWSAANSPRSLRGGLRRGGIGGLLSEKNGFYFLKGRGEIVKARLDRFIHTDRKFKKALRLAKLFKFIPWIKMLAVSNIMGAHNLKEESDIDFFIIADKNRVWLTRFFCAGLTKVLRLRPKQNNVRDKICLNFYVSEKAMDLESLMLDVNVVSERFPKPFKGFGNHLNSLGKDIYFIHWLAGLAPIYNRDEIYERFVEANKWLREHLPNWRAKIVAGRRQAPRHPSHFYGDIADLLFGGLENTFQKLQLKLMPAGLKKLMNKDTKVVINGQVLKLHINDRREEYLEKYVIKMENVKIKMKNECKIKKF